MSSDRKPRGLYLPGPSEQVNDLPRVSHFYLFAYIGPWKAPLQDALRSNLRTLSDALPGSLVVLLEDLALMRKFSAACGLKNVEDKVGIFVTETRPGAALPGSDTQGLLLDLGKVTPEQVPAVLTTLLGKLADEDFASGMKWEMRKLALKRLVDRFAFDVVLTAVGFTG